MPLIDEQAFALADRISAAMALAFAEIEAATKDKTNPHFKTKYADLGAVIDAIKPALINHGLYFMQHCHPSEDGVVVETVLAHSSGARESLGKLYVPANKRDPQGFGSALTYARRYALQTAFGVPTEDDDGQAASKGKKDTDASLQLSLDGIAKCKTIAALKAWTDRNWAAVTDEHVDAVQAAIDNQKIAIVKAHMVTA